MRYIAALLWAVITAAIVGGVVAVVVFLLTGSMTYAGVAFWLVGAVSFIGRLLPALAAASQLSAEAKHARLAQSRARQEPAHIVWLYDGKQKVLFFREPDGRTSWTFDPPPPDGMSGLVMSTEAMNELTRQQRAAGIPVWYPESG